jgi:hypothetical protein
VLGTANASGAVTTLTVGGDFGGVEPALALENAEGPSLRMNALSHTWAGQLAVGEMAGTDLGPQAPLAQAQLTRATTGRIALVDEVRKTLGLAGR